MSILAFAQQNSTAVEKKAAAAGSNGGRASYGDYQTNITIRSA
jgi:hypothetical protein